MTIPQARSSQFSVRALLLALSALTLIACDGDDDTTSAGAEAGHMAGHMAGHTAGHMAGHTAGHTAGHMAGHMGGHSGDGSCEAMIPTAEELSASSADERYTLTVTSLSPEIPSAGLNEWSLTITDLEGAPVSGLVVVVEPFMPAHGHGTSPATFALTDEGEGVYSLSELNFVMPGEWSMTYSVSEASGEPVMVMQMICVGAAAE